MNTKINRSAKSEVAAREIIAYINGDESSDGRLDPVVSISHDGDLLFYNAACGTDESEIILIDRLEADSLGDGAGDATAADVIDWLENNCA